MRRSRTGRVQTPPARPHAVLLLALALLAACSAPPPAVDATPPAPTRPVAARPTAAAAPPATPAPPTPSPAPTPAGPLGQIAAWGEGIPLGAAYAPDGQAVAVLRPAALELRGAGQLNALRWSVPLAQRPTGLAFDPDGRAIAVSAGAAVDLYAGADGAHLGQIPGLGAPIADVAISPDGRLLAAAQEDQVISLWDIAERSPLSQLRLPQPDDGFIVPGAFTSVAFSPDGQHIAAGDDGGNVAVWAVADGVALQALSVGLRVVADVAFSPDGASVAAASEGWRAEPGAVWIWDVASGAELHWLSVDDGVRFLAPAERLAFAPGGAQVLMGLADGSILAWRLADAALDHELTGHGAAITALAYAPDGGVLSASRDGSLRTWRPDGAAAETAAGPGAISALALSPDGALAISGDEGGAIDIRRPDGSPLAHIAAHRGQVSGLAVSPDGATLASAGHDGLVRLWRLPGGEAAGELPGHEGPALAVAFAPDGSHLASAGRDGVLRLWRLAAGAAERSVAVLETDGVSDTSLAQVAYSPDGAIVAVAGSEGAVSLWRGADLTLIERRPLDGALRVDQAAFTPAGALLARSGGQIYAWAAPPAPPATILGPDSVAFATLPDGAIAALAGGSLQIWRGPPGALERYADAAAPGFSSLAAAPGIILIGSRGGAVSAWAVR